MHIPTILFRLFTRISGQAIAQAFVISYFSREFFPSVFFFMDSALVKYIRDLGKLIRLDTETAPSNNSAIAFTNGGHRSFYSTAGGILEESVAYSINHLGIIKKTGGDIKISRNHNYFLRVFRTTGLMKMSW